MVKLEHLLHFLEETFAVSDFPDYPNALNGLQVDGPAEVHRLSVAVDASEATIRQALTREPQLLLVHHGLFWDGFGPLTGPRFRKVEALVHGKMALYSLHLPLDAHPELGNCAGLCRAMGLEPTETFGDFKGRDIGCWAHALLDRDVLAERVSSAVGGRVRLIPGGPEVVERVGVLTGGGASALWEARERGLDALVTGEAAHHHYHEAMELGVNLYLGGHYFTETFGVKALGEVLSREFDLEWEFLDLPTGM
jgi:dinuclear metal center YbgI/SA1388 family protein